MLVFYVFKNVLLKYSIYFEGNFEGIYVCSICAITNSYKINNIFLKILQTNILFNLHS